MTIPTPEPSCADDREPGVLSVRQARRLIMDAVTPLSETETVPLQDAHGRVLAEDLTAAFNIPGHTNAAVDGYALAGADLPSAGQRAFTMLGSALAGAPFGGACRAGACVRVTTGAVMPDGTDTVVMQEHAALEQGRVTIAAGQRARQNVRHAGEDIAAGAVVLRRGRHLTAADLGLAASTGRARLAVLRRPRVAVLSTGDELRLPPAGPQDAPAAPELGAVYDANRYILHGLLQRLGATVLDLGIAPDTRRALRRALAKVEADVIMTSGGASVGAADHIRAMLAQDGLLRFSQVAIKPGRPLTFGQYAGKLFFGLPGNPVAVLVTFCQFVRPALQRLGGGSPRPPLEVAAQCLAPIHKKPGRYELVRAIYTAGADGMLSARPTARQGSGVLTSMHAANCFIALDEQRGSVKAGEAVLIQPFDGLL